MRKLKIMEHMSLDGVIEVGADFVYGDWTGPYRAPEGLQTVMARYGERFDLLLGRKTYDDWSGFWAEGKSPLSVNNDSYILSVKAKRLGYLFWFAVSSELDFRDIAKAFLQLRNVACCRRPTSVDLRWAAS
ncbi:MAG TPA: hypothetical protein VN612_09190 [Acidobacteriaceae bacterium]|nr:hypothetical protein [Acidobacteriaceae bacterium]